MPLPRIYCLALRCSRNPRGFRFRGYRKCFGCFAARAKVEGVAQSKAYDVSNFNLAELEQMAREERSRRHHG